MAEGVYGGQCIERHTAAIHDRGGIRRKPGGVLVDISSVTYGRTRSGLTQAKIVISGRACSSQSQSLNNIQVRRDELVIYRGQERAFEGPVIQVSWYHNRVEITAFDVTEYLRGTPLTKYWPNSDDGGPELMHERIQEIIDYELTQPYEMSIGTGAAKRVVTVPRWEFVDPPANLIDHIEVRPGTVITRSITEAFEMTVGEHLDNLSRSGMDYVAVGRKVVIWDSAQALGKTRKVTDADFYGDLEVIASGSDFAAIGHVSANREVQEGEAPPVLGPGEVYGVGNAGEPSDYYGVWTKIFSTDSEEGEQDPSQNALNGQAQRNMLGRNPVPLIIRVPSGAGFRMGRDITLAQLVPGVIMPVVATLNLKKVTQEQLIDSVKVTETATEESVSLTLVPAGPLLLVGEED